MSPKEIMGSLDTIIPEVVIQAVNNLLKKGYRGDSVTLRQSDIVAEIIRLDNNITSHQAFDSKWLDFEALFERAGWKVVYDKPGYNETYPATFEFTPIKD